MTLPRVHAVTDASVLARPDFIARAAALATLGPRLAIHVRDRRADGRTLWAAADAVAALARPHGAVVVVNARPDIAAMVGADAMQLGAGDIATLDARRVAPRALVGRSVHALVEAGAAIADGADFLVFGSVFPTPSHPGAAATGTTALRRVVALGRPVLAIGGITAANAAAAHAAGAHGVAAIRAIWGAPDPADAARALLAPWEDAA